MFAVVIPAINSFGGEAPVGIYAQRAGASS
jgi:hypothetical protein